MSVIYSHQTYDSVADITGPSGWYGIRVNNKTVPLYVNQDFSGGGWVCVMANRRFTGGMNNLTFHEAVYGINYRTEPSVDDGANTRGNGPSSLSSLAEFNIWIGLDYWKALAGRYTANKITIAQFASNVNGTSLSGSHSERHLWQFDRFDQSDWRFTGASNIAVQVGANESGMYGYHALSGFGLTTYDRDVDQNAGNCGTYYNNNPFWYGSCWSGSMFGGGSYVDAPYWTSSSAGWDRQYMAVYIK